MSGPQTGNSTIYTLGIVGEEDQYKMVAWQEDGETCITFAACDENNEWMVAPYPRKFIESEEKLQAFALALYNKGLILVQTPDQMRHLS